VGLDFAGDPQELKTPPASLRDAAEITADSSRTSFRLTYPGVDAESGESQEFAALETGSIRQPERGAESSKIL